MLSIPVEMSRRILASCKSANVTFGHAFPVISQVAHTRLLHRLRRQKKISDDEWAERLRQTMHFDGPLSLRGHLNPEWQRAGGWGELGPYCSSYRATLPFMPTINSRRSFSLPLYQELLSKERFLYRSRLIKRQMSADTKHPLHFEFNVDFHRRRAMDSKEKALLWQKMQRTNRISQLFGVSPPSATSEREEDYIVANGGSSMGNLDLLLPPEYPLPSSDSEKSVKPEPILRATLTTNRLRCRPSELYLGTFMSGRQIHLFVFWDGNVYETALIKEWLDEVRNATEWYLGDAEETSNAYACVSSRL